jgi:hypothetical protein
MRKSHWESECLWWNDVTVIHHLINAVKNGGTRGEVHTLSLINAINSQHNKSPMIFKIGNEFGNMLKNVKPIHAPQNFIDLKIPILLEFPDGMYFPYQGQSRINSVYVWKPGFSQNVLIHCPTIDGPTMGSPGNYDGNMLSFACDLLGKSIDDIAQQNHIGDPQNEKALLGWISNCLLYLNSGTPDLRPYKKPKIFNLTKSKKKLRKIQSLPSLPMTLVGFGWKKPILYSVSGTTVRPHWRWQYYPSKQNHDLIWIKEHTRKFSLCA